MESGSSSASSRKKAPPYQECELRLLMSLYTDGFDQYHKKFMGGRCLYFFFAFRDRTLPASKTGPSDRGSLLKKFAKEVSELGIWKRTEKSIEERIKADTKRVRKYLSDEVSLCALL